MSKDETRVDDYEAFIERRLRVDLAALQKKEERLVQKIDDYEQFLVSLQLTHCQNLHSFTAQVKYLMLLNTLREMEMRQAPLGSGVSVEAIVCRPEEVFVHVGLGCYVACSYSEAVDKVTLLKSICESQLSEIHTEMGRVRATMEFMTQSIEALHTASMEDNM